MVELHPDKICPVGTSGGGCTLATLDLSYCKVGQNTAFAMCQVSLQRYAVIIHRILCVILRVSQALRAWIRTSVPNEAVILHAAKSLPTELLSAGLVLSAAFGCGSSDVPPHYGVLPGLSQVCLAGTRVVPADLAPLVEIQTTAESQIVTALRKVWFRRSCIPEETSSLVTFCCVSGSRRVNRRHQETAV